LLVVFFVAACPAVAETYYGDVVVSVDASGSSTVSGTANHPMLSPRVTDSFTSKRGSYWLFNLTFPGEDVFSEYVFEVLLPSGASVNYVKSSGQFRIVDEGKRIGVKVSGTDESPSVIVQYQLADKETDSIPWEYVVLAAVGVAAVAAAFFLYRRRRAAAGLVGAEDAAVAGSDVLSDRQRDILKVITDEGRPVNQTVVCDRLGLPKSSVSRNVDTLVSLGILKKTRVGMSTMLSLNDEKR